MLSCAPSEGRVSGIVDVPNAVCTLAVPTRIFSVDVRPKKLTPGVSCKLAKVSPNCPISTYDGKEPTFKNPSGDY